MVTVQFFGGPKDGQTMALPELRSVVHISTKQPRVYDYQLRIAEGNAVVLADGNYAFDVVGSGRDMR
jgi:hypothetical protein